MNKAGCLQDGFFDVSQTLKKGRREGGGTGDALIGTGNEFHNPEELSSGLKAQLFY